MKEVYKDLFLVMLKIRSVCNHTLNIKCNVFYSTVTNIFVYFLLRFCFFKLLTSTFYIYGLNVPCTLYVVWLFRQLI